MSCSLLYRTHKKYTGSTTMYICVFSQRFDSDILNIRLIVSAIRAQPKMHPSPRVRTSLIVYNPHSETFHASLELQLHKHGALEQAA